jgi:two-component system, cell cycle sensor histidine kinase and response regulator CckA
MGDIHILVVEDSPPDLEITRAAIAASGLGGQVHVATDGEQALRFLYREPPYVTAPRPDLVLLDLHLPKLDGRSLLTLIKGDPKLRSTLVIVLTTGPFEGDIARTTLGQANGHIEKPVDQLKLSKAVSGLREDWAQRGPPQPAAGEAPLVLEPAGSPANGSPSGQEILSASPERSAPLGTTNLEAAAPLSILIVEDSDFDARLLTRHLNKALGETSVQITRTDKLRQAKEALSSTKFDVIVVDLGLPDSRGLEALNTLQRIAPSTPVVVLTGTADEDLGRAALRAGAQDYLVKGEMGGAALTRSLRYAIERQSLNNQLMIAQRMQVLGQLAGGVAHDFNNLLTIISNNAALLAESSDNCDRDAVAEIGTAVQRGAMLTRQLLAISQKRVFESGEIDMNALVQESAKLLGRSLAGIRLSVELSPELPRVRGDYGLLEQVLMSLALNARDAMPKGGTLRFVTDTVSEPSGETSSRVGPHEHYIRLQVIDSGDGIEPGILGRIWEPFFTTKEAQGSTGLGLATARSIIDQHNGDIQVESQVGRGTAFIILLPESPVPSTRLGPAPEPSPPPEGRRILIVDDERAILRTCQRFLERDKHQVFTAASAEAALLLWTAENGRFDLVLTDLQMPDGMGGRELGERLRASCPNLPIVYASGYSKDLLTHQMGIERGITFIEKPYTADELRSTVARALAQSTRTSEPSRPKV